MSHKGLHTIAHHGFAVEPFLGHKKMHLWRVLLMACIIEGKGRSRRKAFFNKRKGLLLNFTPGPVGLGVQQISLSALVSSAINKSKVYTRAGLEPRLLDLESSALTMRPWCLP